MPDSVTFGRLARTLLAGASMGALLSTAPALAQTAAPTSAPAATTSDADNDSGAQVGEIVVTGTRNRMKVLETSYGVTVLNQEAIQHTNPVGLTDLASSIPGLQGEHANGETNSNLNVRGTEAGFISFISLQEDGLPVVYSPFFAEYEIRNDLSYGRVEAVLGGPSGVFTAQGAAATLNFLSRLPRTTEGEAKLSLTDFGEVRADAFYGGPIGHDGWYGAIGGHYRQSNGSRDLGFVGNRGGQVRASVRREWSNGSISLAYKHIDDSTDYVNPLPVDVSGRFPTALPGFNARDDSLVGPDLRFVHSISPGGAITRDLARGQHENSDQFTLAAEYHASDSITISNRMRYNNINTSSQDMRGFANASLVNANAYLASQLPVLQAAFPTATSVRLVRVGDGSVVANPGTMNGNGLITTSDAIDYMRHNKHFIDTFEVNYHNDRLNLTAGLQYWSVQQQSGMVSDRILHDITNHAHRMDVEALNASGQVVGHLTKDGVIAFSDVNNYGGLDTTSVNPYFNAQLEVSNNLRIDAGIRYEHAVIDGYAQDVNTGVANNGPYYDPRSIATYTYAVLPNSQSITGHTSWGAVSWTIGANLKLSSNLAVYGRYASAADMGFNNEFSFFSVPGFGTPASAHMGLTNTPTRLNFGEVGVRYLGSVVSGSVTAFYTLHKNSGVILALSNGGNQVFPVDTTAYGAEFWFDVRPSDNFNISLSGVVMDSKKTGSGFNAVPTYRLPNTQLRISPTWTLGRVRINATGQYYSTRYADQAATRQLPAYLDLSAGIAFQVNDALTLSLEGRNLTNAFAFTSGNFREGFTQGNSPFGYASAIPGRVLRLVADARF